MNIFDGCDDDQFNIFQTQMTLEFAGNVNEVSNLELFVTENGSRMTYNQLAEDLCDPLLRRMLNATVKEVEPVPAQLSSKPSFRVRYLVVGNCRGCAPNTPLFSDTSNTGRALNAGNNGRRVENKCGCPEGTNVLERAPTTGEYTVAYNEWLEDKHEAGTVDPDNIARVLETVELGNSNDTSAAFHTGRLRGADVGNIFFLFLVMLKMIM
mmetsp:Transcript_21379/g.29750  ORF Transcript_21379/g.29750 Transcript_21379/m.29750 type:complete len:210 (+) Transcript_21379:30-659(+)